MNGREGDPFEEEVADAVMEVGRDLARNDLAFGKVTKLLGRVEPRWVEGTNVKQGRYPRFFLEVISILCGYSGPELEAKRSEEEKQELKKTVAEMKTRFVNKKTGEIDVEGIFAELNRRDPVLLKEGHDFEGDDEYDEDDDELKLGEEDEIIEEGGEL